MSMSGSGTIRKQVIVGMADMKASNDPVGLLCTYVLGSCVAVSVYDPVVKVGGILHFMLPESAINTQKALQNPYFFADTGIPLLFRSAYRLGAEKERIICRMAGASNVIDPSNIFKVGMQNHLAAMKILVKNHVAVASEYVGGLSAVTLKLHLNTGRAVVSLPSGEEMEI